MSRPAKTVDKAQRSQSSSRVVKRANNNSASRLTLAASGDETRRFMRDERRGRNKKRNAEIYQRQKERRKAKREAKKLRDADPVAERARRTPRMGLPTKGELLPTPSTHVGRLFTVYDWHRQVGKIYREMRRHQIDPGFGTRLTYVANVGATLARFIEETAPKGVEAPPDYSRLDDKELEQLELLLAKAAGPAALERLEQSKPPADWRERNA
jgi:hypothetical protein